MGEGVEGSLEDGNRSSSVMQIAKKMLELARRVGPQFSQVQGWPDTFKIEQKGEGGPELELWKFVGTSALSFYSWEIKTGRCRLICLSWVWTRNLNILIYSTYIIWYLVPLSRQKCSNIMVHGPWIQNTDEESLNQGGQPCRYKSKVAVAVAVVKGYEKFNM